MNVYTLTYIRIRHDVHFREVTQIFADTEEQAREIFTTINGPLEIEMVELDTYHS